MRVMVVGSGAREHALCWKLKSSASKVYCLPGNAGTINIAETGAARTIPELAEFAQKERIDLTVVGPEAYLAAGIVDYFRAHGLTIFGPTQQGAQIESSKAVAKEIMAANNVPTARAATFTDPDEAKEYIRNLPDLPVIKADGLATGKGVILPETLAEANQAVDELMVTKVYGAAGEKILVEERLSGPEVSVLVLTDGQEIRLFPPAQDHKRAYDGDKGPNTGGMGAFAPSPLVDAQLLQEIVDTIVRPTLQGLAASGAPYSGLLYVGLMLTDQGPKVIEFNCRFGDPETQVVLPLVDADLAQLLYEVAIGQLRSSLPWKEEAVVSVVLASGGYPGPYQKGLPIVGLDQLAGLGVEVFHAGTALQSGRVVTAGGRILNVMATGSNIGVARQKVYQALDKIKIKDAYYRKDIGIKI